jgi:hypothetical protein
MRDPNKSFGKLYRTPNQVKCSLARRGQENQTPG